MSDRNLYKRKGIWYARVKTGKHDKRCSLRTSSKVEAHKKLRKILDEVDHVRHTGEHRHSWKEAVVMWSTQMNDGVKPRVLLRYKISLRLVGPILAPLYVDEVTTKVIARLVTHRKADGSTNATIKRDLTAVSSVLRFCCGQGWIDENAARNYDRSLIRERRDPIALPDPKDIDALAAFAPDKFRNVIRFAQYTGMRQNEIATLERDRVRGNTVDLWKTKADTPRAVPLDKRARGTVDGTKAHETESWLFWHDNGLPFIGIKSQFRDIMARAVAAGKVKRRFRFHDLRHWFAVDYLRRGGNIYDLQQILGHSSIKTTEGYLKYLTPDEQKVAKFGKVAHKGRKYTAAATSGEDAK